MLIVIENKMGEKFIWQVNTIKVLIQNYEANEMLYNTKHKHYKNRNKRIEVYNEIAKAINESNMGEGTCTIDEVRKKLNGLRSQYLGEKLKIIKSMKSGADGDKIYTPTVYWFALLKFLESTTTPDESTSNLDYLEDNSQVTPTEGEGPSTSQATNIQKKRRCEPEPEYGELLQQASKTMKDISCNISANKSTTPKTDEVHVFTGYIASELRSIRTASNDYMYRQAKRKINLAILDIWDDIDRMDRPNTNLSYVSDYEISMPSINTTSEQSLGSSIQQFVTFVRGDEDEAIEKNICEGELNSGEIVMA